MIDYNEMAIFAKVVDAGSYTRAADKLGLPKSTVSRKITQLEERLGVRLLHRTTRAIKPTEMGKAYYNHCSQMVTEAEEAQRSIHQLQAEPSGLLRITAPVSFGANFLVEAVQAFLASHPQVKMDVILDNKVLDLVEDEIDVAFRVGPMSDSSLVARNLGTIRPIICASPDYIKKRGALRSVADLNNHSCIMHNNIPWVLQGPNGRVDVDLEKRLLINDLDMTKRMLVNGYGIGLLPITMACDEIERGQLVQVLPEYHFSDRDIYLVYHSRRQLPTKVVAFIEFVMARCKPVAPWELHKEACEVPVQRPVVVAKAGGGKK